MTGRGVIQDMAPKIVGRGVEGRGMTVRNNRKGKMRGRKSESEREKKTEGEGKIGSGKGGAAIWRGRQGEEDNEWGVVTRGGGGIESCISVLRHPHTQRKPSPAARGGDHRDTTK